MDWKEIVQQYEYEKRQAQVPLVPIERVRHRDIKSRETQYNPITQKYSNPNVENQAQQIEQTKYIDKLARNKDRSLRYEQIFDIINLDNKLKGLEGKPNYPYEKPPKYDKKDANSTIAKYNILSNKNFTEHHFLQPELRPKSIQEKVKVRKTTTTGLRDYNILTGRYFENHDNKNQ